MKEDKHRVCPVERAGRLEGRVRRWMQKPAKIVGSYVREGMAVLDFGCGPGFFTIPMAQMVGATGHVIACDLQQGMLDKLGDKIKGSELEKRIVMRQCGADAIGIDEAVDFILAFYVVHEVPDAAAFFREAKSILKPGGKMLVAEPNKRVTRKEFDQMLEIAGQQGWAVVVRPGVFMSRAVVME